MRATMRFAGFLLVTALAAGCGASSGGSAVSGSVTADDATSPGGRKAVSGVTVQLVDLDRVTGPVDPAGESPAFIASTVTGVDGGYTFGDLPAGRYDVLALPAGGVPWFDRATASDEGPLVVEEGQSRAFRVDFVAQAPGNAIADIGKCRCSVGCGFSTIFYFICWPICCASCYTKGTYAYQLCFGFDPDF